MPSPTINATPGKVCPFCALLCEYDIPAASAAAKGKCAKAARGYAPPGSINPPMVAGRECTMAEAIAAAGKILRKAKRPLLAGLDTDVAGIRSAVALAQKCDAVLDHMHGDAISAYAGIMREARWFSTTLAELRQRADLLLCIGCDFTSSQPLLLQRIMQGAPKKRLLSLACKNMGKLPNIQGKLTANIPESQVALAMDAIKLKLQGKNCGTLLGKNEAFWQKFANALMAAKYVGVIYKGNGATGARIPQLRRVMQLVELLNKEHNRAAIYSVNNGEGAITAMQAGLWLTGFPLRVAYSKGRMQHDPVRYATKRLLHNSEVDALLWVASTSDGNTDGYARAPATPGVPRIILSRMDRKPYGKNDVYIPVATPGINCDGTLFRSDAVSALGITADKAGNAQFAVANILDSIREEL